MTLLSFIILVCAFLVLVHSVPVGFFKAGFLQTLTHMGASLAEHLGEIFSRKRSYQRISFRREQEATIKKYNTQLYGTKIFVLILF